MSEPIETASPPRRHRHFGSERGIALLMVLWVIVILALVAATFMHETRAQVRIAHNLIENAKAEAAADAGVNLAMQAVLEPEISKTWRLDGHSYLITFGESTIRLTPQDESGLIDLNRSNESVLVGLFGLAGAAPREAKQLAAAVADFRDGDSERSEDGAEDADYAVAGLSHDAKDAPFATVDELHQVLGMTQELYERISPYATVYAPNRNINLAAAPVEILRALPYLSDEQRQSALRSREVGAAEPGRIWWASTLSVTAEAVTNSGGHFVREVVLRRASDAGRPFQILRWQRRWSSDIATSGTEP